MDAFAKIKSLIPDGSSIMNGASITLEQIGFTEHLKAGNHGWKIFMKESSQREIQ